MIQQTSLKAFNDVKPKLNAQRAKILNIIKLNKQLNNTMISVKTNLPINVVTPRVNELRKMGYIELAEKGICPFTKKLTMFWRVTQ